MKSVDFVLNIIPDSVVGAFAKGDILQVLLFAILFGFALMALGDRATTVRNVIDDVAHAIVRPIGVAVSIGSVTERPACRRYASRRWTISPRGGGCGWPGPGLGRWMRRERVPEANEPRCEPGKSHVQLI